MLALGSESLVRQFDTSDYDSIALDACRDFYASLETSSRDLIEVRAQ